MGVRIIHPREFRPRPWAHEWGRVAPEWRSLAAHQFNPQLLVLPEPGAGARNLVGRRSFPAVAGTPSNFWSRVGQGVDYSSASSVQDYPADNHGGSPDLTLFVVVRYLTFGSGITYSISTDGGTGSDGLSIAKNASDQLGLVKNGQGAYTATTMVYSAGVDYAIVAQYTGASDSARILFRPLNGDDLVVVASTGDITGPAVAATVDNEVRLGGGNTTSSSDLAIMAAGIWFSRLPDSLADRLVSDPFGWYRPVRRRSYFVQAGGGGFQSAWARGSNVVLQPGRGA